MGLAMGLAVVACQPKAEQAAEGETDAAATEAAAEVADSVVADSAAVVAE